MGALPYEVPVSSELMKETAISDESSIGGKYKGGNLLGWNLYAPEKAKVIIYDSEEKAEGKNYGPISLNKEESIRDWFGAQGIGFEKALYWKVIEGKVEGVLFCDIEWMIWLYGLTLKMQKRKI